MKLKYQFILTVPFSILSAIQGYGQNDLDNYKNQLKLSPLKIIDLINPGLEVSYERRTGNFSTQISAAYLTDVFNISGFSQLKGFRVGLEEKYFVNIPNKKIFRQTANFQPYLATNLSLSNIDYKFESRFGTEAPDTGIPSNGYLDAFGVKKQTVALNFRYGFQTIYHQFVFDVSFGIGLKYKNVKHYDRDFPEDKIDESRHFNVYDIANQEMNGLTFNLPATIKIGYVF